MCLGVLGRHIPWLRFLDVMIGDEPPLSPDQSFYQRALAADIDEAVDQAVEIFRRRSLSYVYDKVVMEALNASPRLIFAEDYSILSTLSKSTRRCMS